MNKLLSQSGSTLFLVLAGILLAGSGQWPNSARQNALTAYPNVEAEVVNLKTSMVIILRKLIQHGRMKLDLSNSS